MPQFALDDAPGWAWSRVKRATERGRYGQLILDHVYDHEAGRADRVFLVQPTGAGQVIEYTWYAVLSVKDLF